jgi:hypothetical protein
MATAQRRRFRIASVPRWLQRLLFQGFSDRHGVLESEISRGVDGNDAQIKSDFPASFAQNPLKTGVKRKKTQKTPRKPV